MSGPCACSRSWPDDAAERTAELLDEPPVRELRRARPDGAAVPRTCRGSVQRLDERLYHGGVEEDSGLVLHHRVEHATGPQRHHRRTEGHRLQRRDSEIFDAREDEAACAGDGVEDHLSRYGAEEPDVGPALAAKR